MVSRPNRVGTGNVPGGSRDHWEVEGIAGKLLRGSGQHWWELGTYWGALGSFRQYWEGCGGF